MAERAVGDDRDAVLLAPGDHGVLDGALLEMVEDLVAGDAALRRRSRRASSRSGIIEIAHAPGEDLPFAPKLLEGRERLLQRVVTPPVQEVAVQPVGLEARERPLAGRDRPAPRGILREDLGDQEDLVASPGDRLGDQILGGADRYISAVSMWVMPRSRPRRSASIVAAASSLSLYQVPWPITGTLRWVGPNGRRSMLELLDGRGEGAHQHAADSRSRSIGDTVPGRMISSPGEIVGGPDVPSRRTWALA